MAALWAIVMSLHDGRREMELSDTYLRSIGRAIAGFNTLEMIVRSLVWSLMNTSQEVALAVTGSDAFEALRQKLERLVGVADFEPELEKAFRQWLRDVDAANEQRRKVAHSLWLLPPGDDLPTMLRVTRRGVQVERMSQEGIDAAADRIEAVVRQSFVFLRELEVMPLEPPEEEGLV